MTFTPADEGWLRLALDLSRRCPPAAGAYDVGSVVVGGGHELATGFSRETDDRVHAEESALAKLAGTDLSGTTIYSTLEPCSRRASRPRSCTRLILDAGIRRVVFVLREPPLFVVCQGVEELTAAGVEVVEAGGYADEVRSINARLLGPG